MKKNRFPPGWDEARVQRVLRHYQRQSEADAVAEDEAAFDSKEGAMVEVPYELIPAVRELISGHRR